MDEQANASESFEAARLAADALSRGDFVALRELLAEDVVWFANGDPDQPGTYRGRDEVIAALRVQRAQGEINTEAVVEAEEPEVAAFAFGSAANSSYFTVNATAPKQECAETVSIVQVQGPMITSFGSMPAPRTF
jgi:ketosteroid isomerase-like protein